MNAIYIKFPEGKGKAVTFSYDDGIIQDKRLIELFDKYGLRATFNLSSKVFYDRDVLEVTDWWKPMTLEEARELYKDTPHEIALHAHTHPFPHALHSTDLMTYDVIKNREILEREFGGIITGMAYPQGTYTQDTIDALKASGVSYCRTVKNTYGFNYPPENWLTLHPTCHHNYEKIFELIDKFMEIPYGDAATSGMFYIWGHSYELDVDNNWDHMEKICEKISGKDDIWYATNIEIYNYQKAFEALRISLDGKVIHNPSATDVWIRYNYNIFQGKTVKIPAGETVIL